MTCPFTVFHRVNVLFCWVPGSWLWLLLLLPARDDAKTEERERRGAKLRDEQKFRRKNYILYMIEIKRLSNTTNKADKYTDIRRCGYKLNSADASSRIYPQRQPRR